MQSQHVLEKTEKLTTSIFRQNYRQKKVAHL
jgi:hypothetical protein